MVSNTGLLETPLVIQLSSPAPTRPASPAAPKMYDSGSPTGPGWVRKLPL
jgi:hypothetical protein